WMKEQWPAVLDWSDVTLETSASGDTGHCGDTHRQGLHVVCEPWTPFCLDH
ncbi:hypothetical protein BgiMline_001873, partial [Biomphalaria glabrata]